MTATNPLFNANRLKLGVFGFNGQAPSNTILDELYVPSWPRILDIGLTADAAGFEALVPFARWKYGRSRNSLNAAAMDVYDPFIWAAGLAQATRHIALLATSHMSLVHPVIAAKQAATIDQVSGGRFALNVVAGWNEPEFQMFGGSLQEHSDRYAQAAEWMQVINQLWRVSEEFDFEGRLLFDQKRRILSQAHPEPDATDHARRTLGKRGQLLIAASEVGGSDTLCRTPPALFNCFPAVGVLPICNLARRSSLPIQ